jgi:hypothetical protein
VISSFEQQKILVFITHLLNLLKRSCLHDGVEPWFMPMTEPWRNGMVESFNNRYQQRSW